jgi:hypothetical protein
MSSKPIPQAIIRWPAGLDAPPEIRPLGDNDVVTEQIRAVLIKALKLKPSRRRIAKSNADGFEK